MGPRSTSGFVVRVSPKVSFNAKGRRAARLYVGRLVGCVRNTGRTPAILSINYKDKVLSVMTLGLNTGRIMNASLSTSYVVSAHSGVRIGRLSRGLNAFCINGLVSSARLRGGINARGCSVIITGVLTSIVVPVTPIVPSELGRNKCFVASNVVSFGRGRIGRTVRTTKLGIVRVGRRNR